MNAVNLHSPADRAAAKQKLVPFPSFFSHCDGGYNERLCASNNFVKDLYAACSARHRADLNAFQSGIKPGKFVSSDHNFAMTGSLTTYDPQGGTKSHTVKGMFALTNQKGQCVMWTPVTTASRREMRFVAQELKNSCDANGFEPIIQWTSDQCCNVRSLAPFAAAVFKHHFLLYLPIKCLCVILCRTQDRVWIQEMFPDCVVVLDSEHLVKRMFACPLNSFQNNMCIHTVYGPKRTPPSGGAPKRGRLQEVRLILFD